MSDVVRDLGECSSSRFGLAVGGDVVVVPSGVHLMDDPGVDLAVQAAADVKRLLSQASGLQRLVDLGDEVRGEEDPNEVHHDRDAPQRPPPPHDPTC
jgi:hypothetical protein